MTNYIPKLYDQQRECNRLSNVDMITDIWNSHHNQAYTGVTILFVDSIYQLKAYLLEIDNQAYTGVTILFVDSIYQLKAYLLEIVEFSRCSYRC